MVLGRSTTWTLGSVLARLEAGETEVEVYAGPHRHSGTFQGAGEDLLMLQDHGDMVALQFRSITGVRVLGGLQQNVEGEKEAGSDLDREWKYVDQFVPPRPRGSTEWTEAHHAWIRDNLTVSAP